MAGDYILAIASTLIAGLKHDEVTLVLSQVSNFDNPFSPLLDRIMLCDLTHANMEQLSVSMYMPIFFFSYNFIITLTLYRKYF